MSAQRSPYFGRFGGRYVPEVLIHALDELEAGVAAAFADDAFWSEYRDLMRDFV
jgi:tryptophan synthase beta chain